MKEYQFYIILVGLMFIGFNVGFIIFDYQYLINQSILGIIFIFVHSCAILGTLVFGYFRVKEAIELEKDK